MIIKLSEIEDTLTVKGSMDASRFMEVENMEFHIETPVDYTLTVKKFNDTVTIRGPVSFQAVFTCGRCLEEFSRAVSIDMNIRLASGTEEIRGAEFELRNEDMDVYTYEGDEIDIDPFIYEEVLLNMPIRPVCKEDCLGLCGICGKNRNVESCTCSESSHSLLGEKLKSFLN